MSKSCALRLPHDSAWRRSAPGEARRARPVEFHCVAGEREPALMSVSGDETVECGVGKLLARTAAAAPEVVVMVAAARQNVPHRPIFDDHPAKHTGFDQQAHSPEDRGAAHARERRRKILDGERPRRTCHRFHDKAAGRRDAEALPRQLRRCTVRDRHDTSVWACRGGVNANPCIITGRLRWTPSSHLRLHSARRHDRPAREFGESAAMPARSRGWTR